MARKEGRGRKEGKVPRAEMEQQRKEGEEWEGRGRR